MIHGNPPLPLPPNAPLSTPNYLEKLSSVKHRLPTNYTVTPQTTLTQGTSLSVICDHLSHYYTLKFVTPPKGPSCASNCVCSSTTASRFSTYKQTQNVSLTWLYHQFFNSGAWSVTINSCQTYIPQNNFVCKTDQKYRWR